VQLFPGERLDDLMVNGLRIIQSRDMFAFSMDAVLLAHFVTLRYKGRLIDLGTGSGVIPLLATTRQTLSSVAAVEIQERLADMASRSVVYNRLGHLIQVYHMDLKEAPRKLGRGVFDTVTCNPPYLPMGTGEQSPNRSVALARHEIACTLEDVICAGSQLVRSGGRIALVHKPSRLVDIFSAMRAHRVEPKRVRFVHPRTGEPPNRVLVEGAKDGQPGLKVEAPLVCFQSDGSYTQELHRMYFRERGF
jgi:tRNA1(Val) A37 N6-methylase TrmN6